jgi:LmbE family N-acetylglucosaminyl deacetylase
VILSGGGQNSPIVLRRPHFHLTDGDLFFLISRNPHARLSRLEADVWNALEQGPSLEELRRRFSEKAADDVVHRFKGLGVCELAESHYPNGRRRVLVVEPHSDDAVLSIGGTLWARRHECEFVVATVCSRSNFTSYYMLGRDYFDVDAISSLRAAEAELFVRLIGGQYRSLGRSDAPLRYHRGNWSLDWFRRHNSSIGVFISRQASEKELSDWVEVIRDLILNENADQIWIPLGCYHTDHHFTRNACLLALLQNRSLLGHLPVRFYQEVPYDTRFAEVAASVVGVLQRAGAEMAREVVPIASAFGDKLHLVSLYGSQFKLETMRSDIEASARQAGQAEGMAEVFWRVDRLPNAVQPLAFYSDQQGLHRARKRLRPWVQRHRNAPRIRLLLRSPPGGWADDADFLLQAFPEASFDVYATPGAAAEVSDYDCPRVRLHPVGARSVNWMRLGLRMLASAPVPTLLVASKKRFRQAGWLSSLMGSDTAVVPTMDCLMIALRELSSGPGARELVSGM